MENCFTNTTTLDLTDANGDVLKTTEEKGSALLQRFVQQSDQNNPEEKKAVWKVLDRTLTETGSNDDLITELEFTDALSRLSKDTASGHDNVKYSDIKSMSVDDKSELFTLYAESFATARVPSDFRIVSSSQSPKQGRTIAIPYLHNAEHHRKADGTEGDQEACSGPRKEKRTRRAQRRKNHL